MTKLIPFLAAALAAGEVQLFFTSDYDGDERVLMTKYL